MLKFFIKQIAKNIFTWFNNNNNSANVLGLTMIQTQYSNNKISNSFCISFCALHPVRFFIKDSNGGYYQVTTRQKVDCFRKKIVLMLNYEHNLKKYLRKPKSESPAQKAIRKRLVKFLKYRDADYLKNNISCSFARTNSLGETEAYIFTGDSVKITKDASEDISQTHHNAKGRVEVIMDNFNVSYDKAKSMIQDETNSQVSYAKSNYFFRVWSEIQKILGRNDINNSRLDVYFEPYQVGKKTKYNIVDAKLNGR